MDRDLTSSSTLMTVSSASSHRTDLSQYNLGLLFADQTSTVF